VWWRGWCGVRVPHAVSAWATHAISSILPAYLSQMCASACSGARVESVSALNPVDVGACHGMTLGEIRQMLGKDQLAKMRKHPGTARLPGGESQFVSCPRAPPPPPAAPPAPPPPAEAEEEEEEE